MTLRQHIPPMISGFVGAMIAISMLGGVAYAATGGTFVLGRSNTAGATTTLTNSNGTALSLVSKAGTAPLKVSNNVRVPLLNADKLDGLEASSFAKANATFAMVLSGEPVVGPDTVYAIATCPAGSSVIGGTGSQMVDRIADLAVVSYSGPDGENGWVYETVGSNSQPMAMAICYRAAGGAITGGFPLK